MAMFTIFGALIIATLGSASTVNTHNQEVICYLASWSVFRPDAGRFNIENINPSLCTHLVYAFAGLDATTNSIKSLNVEYDITNGAYAKFVNLKKRNPNMKVLIAVGGWTEGSKKYSKMAETPTSRRQFINSVVNFIEEHKFDGLDLDWEYPASRGGIPADKKNFVTLVKELRREFDLFGWTLTAAVGAGKSTIETAYDIPSLSRYLDLIHIMAYDYHGKWDGFTGHNAPLFARDDESLDQKVLNVEYSINHYLKEGADAGKLVLGVGFYGRTFLLANASNFAMGAPAQSSAFSGPYTKEDGFLGYNEICEIQKNETGLWQVGWNRGHQAPYMFRNNMWVSYDDDYSLQAKVRFAQEYGLAGMMIWAIDTDDFQGRCGGSKYPLLRAINKALDENESIRPTGIDKKDRVNFDVSDNRLGKTRYNVGRADGTRLQAATAVTIGLTLLSAYVLA